MPIQKNAGDNAADKTSENSADNAADNASEKLDRAGAASEKIGKLILVGAPLGNIGDASPRLAETLRAVDIIAAEDTRRLHRLLSDLGISTDAIITSYFEGNESVKTLGLLEDLLAGKHIAVITDGGMPSVSDPGYRLVRAAIDAGIHITAAPGPTAPTTALALSGLPSGRFTFEGFVPRKSMQLSNYLKELATEKRTMIFFESPRRIEKTLEIMVNAFGSNRPAALCRELTKTYEDIRRGTLLELYAGAQADPPRGEITLVVGPWEGPDVSEATPEILAAAVEKLVNEGARRNEAMKEVGKLYGLSKRDVYAALLEE